MKIQVSSGGIVIQGGGLTLNTGKLDLKQADIITRSIQANAPITTIDGAIISASSSNQNFVGDVLYLKGQSKDNFNYINAVDGNEDAVYSVNWKGDIATMGTVLSKGLTVDGDTTFKGSIAHMKVSVRANEHIEVPPSCTFLEILDDGAIKNNELVFPSMEHNIYMGQILIILNKDMQPTLNPQVPSGAGVVFIYDGDNWIDIQSLKVPSSHITDVEELTAANDLHIGNVTIEMGRLKLMNYKKSGLIYMGINGVVSTNDKITFTRNTLSTPAIKAERLAADIDVHGHIVKNAYIVDSKLRNTTIINPDISFPDLKGFAYFAKGGDLRSVSGIDMNDEGYMQFDLNKYGLKADGLLKIDGKGQLVNADQLFSETDGSLIVNRISGHTMGGDLDMNNNYIYSSNLRDVGSLEATNISVTNIQIQALLHDYNERQLVTVNSRGELSRVAVDEIMMDPPSSYEEMSISSLTITKNANFEGASINKAKLVDVEFSGESVPFISTKALTVHENLVLKDVKAGLLSVNQDGVVSTENKPEFSSIEADEVKIKTSLQVTGDFTLTSHSDEKEQLLIIDKNGKLKAIGDKELHLKGHSITSSGQLIANKAEIDSLHFSGTVPIIESGSEAEFLVVMKGTGMVSRISRDQLATQIQTAAPQQQHISFESVKSDAATFDKLHLPQHGSEGSSILSIDDKGEVKATDIIEASTISISKTAELKEAHIGSLQLNPKDLATKGPGNLLVVDVKTGNVLSSGTINLCVHTYIHTYIHMSILTLLLTSYHIFYVRI